MASTIYITFIERENCFIKIWGQLDKNLSLYIENTLLQMKSQFDEGHCMLRYDQLVPGYLCCAKFKDGSYYRAKIINVMLNQAVVEVIFIDYGNKDYIQLSCIRSIENFPSIITLPPQSKDFILAGVQYLNNNFYEPSFEVLSNDIRYLDFEYEFVVQINSYILIALKMNGQNITDNLIARKIVLPIEISIQQVLLQGLKIEPVQGSMEQNILPSPGKGAPVLNQQSPIPKLLTYKSLPLAVGSEHMVYVSYVTEGPCLFSIQLQKKEAELHDLMVELSGIKLIPLEENPLPGCVCLARSAEDGFICRAVVTNMVGDSFKVFFVDFGNTEIQTFDNLFQIPFKYVIPKVMATRFALHGLQGSLVSLDMKVAFKNFVDNKVLKMRVAEPHPKTGLALCELWDEHTVSALDFVNGASLLAYSSPTSLIRGFNQEVKVSHVLGCVKFYVQLKKKETDLNELMKDLQTVKISSISSENLQINAPCIALYDVDNMYYRGEIKLIEDNRVTVKYIDYGNVEVVNLGDIKAPISEFITRLRPQAIECCLNGYQNMSPDQDLDNLLEEILLENYFTMKVVDVQSTRNVIDLFDMHQRSVASLLFEKLAKKLSHTNAAVVQENNRTDQFRTKSNFHQTSPSEARGESWRNKSPKQSPNWRTTKSPSNERNKRTVRGNVEDSASANSSFDSEYSSYSTEYRRKPRDIDDETNKRGGFNSRPPRDGGGDRTFRPKSDRSGNEYSNKQRSYDNNGSPRGKKSFSTDGSRSPTKDIKYDRKVETSPKHEVRKNYAELTAQFINKEVTPEVEHNVSVSWFYNPAHFYCQLQDDKKEFDKMMIDIQYAYKKCEPLTAARVGNSVIALFNQDKALYRAVIIDACPEGNKWKVKFVDFGNVSIATKIYKVETRFMKLPIQAIECSLVNGTESNQQWPKPSTFTSYFTRDTYTCVILNASGGKYVIDLAYRAKSIKSALKAAGLLGEPENAKKFDIAFLEGQQIKCTIQKLNGLNDFAIKIQDDIMINCQVFQHDIAENVDIKLFRSLQEQVVIAYVDAVGNSRLSVTLYDTKGNFIPIINLMEGMYDTVIPICEALVVAPVISGFVSHTTEKLIYLQNDSTAINELLEGMHEFYDGLATSEFDVKKNEIYAVHSTDGNWYRGLTIDIIDDLATVHYIDTGKEEDVKKTALSILDELFYNPYLAIEIAVKDASSYIHNRVSVKMSFNESNWMGEILSFEKAMQPITTPQLDSEPQNKVDIQSSESTIHQLEAVADSVVDEQLQAPSVGFGVELSHFDNPGQFYLQLTSALDDVEELQNILRTKIETLPEIENINTGIICAAPYSADQVWYRAQVLDVDSDITTVRFIDFGNTDVLRSDIKVKTLPIELLSLDEYARQCSLYLSPVNGDWSTEACSKFEELTLNSNLTAEIMYQDKKTTFLRLYANGTCINDLFIKENYAEELNVKTQTSFTGFVSHLNSPTEFWFQYEHACSDLEWIADQLVNAEQFNTLDDQAPGALCAAVFPDDESWYRARILSNTVAGIEVLFIDYGNSCTCTSVRELPEELVMVSPLAQKCSLVKPDGMLEWPANAAEKFREISADGVTVFTVIKHAPGETNNVQLLLDNEDISEKLKPDLYDGTITHFTSLAQFIVRKCTNNDKLLNLPNSTVNGKIVEHPNGSLVINVNDCSFPKETVTIPPLSETVKMNPLFGFEWSEESEIKFQSLFEIGSTVLQFEEVNKQNVRIYSNGRDIRLDLPATKCINSLQNSPKKLLREPDENVIASETTTDNKNLMIATDIAPEAELINSSIIAEPINPAIIAEPIHSTIIAEPAVTDSLDEISIDTDTLSLNSATGTEASDTKESKHEVLSDNTPETNSLNTTAIESEDEEQAIIKDSEMFLELTDQLLENVMKQCCLIDKTATEE